MSDPTALPLQFLKANLVFQLEVGRLLRQGGQHWAEFAARAIGEEIGQRDSGIRELLRSGDWQALSALPAGALCRQLQQRIGDGQDLARTATIAQKTFAEGLAAAVQAWQRASAEALAAGTGAGPEAAWRAMIEPRARLMAAIDPTSGADSQGSGARDD